MEQCEFGSLCSLLEAIPVFGKSQLAFSQRWGKFRAWCLRAWLSGAWAGAHTSPASAACACAQPQPAASPAGTFRLALEPPPAPGINPLAKPPLLEEPFLSFLPWFLW